LNLCIPPRTDQECINSRSDPIGTVCFVYVMTQKKRRLTEYAACSG